jgi:ribonuclease R
VSAKRPQGRDESPLPAPRGALVAVLERRGRFLTAEPLFPRQDRSQDTPRRGGAERIVLRSPGPERGRRDARPGDLVLVHLSPRKRSPKGAGASIVRVLGRPDVATDLIEALMLDRGLRRGFDPAVEREARGAGEHARQSPVARRDLRDLTTFTIDPISARDFDDAVSAEDLGDGRARVWVHIADVAAHVPEGSLIDREARRRATSVYVPGAVEPMLPHALSSDACSLVPGAERPAVTVELELDGPQVQRTSFYRSLIRSDQRLDYERVDRIFAGEERAAEPWGEPLAVARRVAAELQGKRERSGALVVESEEPEFSFDDQGNLASVSGRVQTESHRLIEHLMIAANEAVARLLLERDVPCLFRVHERPTPERIERLVDQLASLDIATPPLPEQMSSTQAAELVGAISRRVDEHIRRTGHGRMALSSLVLRSLKQAYYSSQNLGHAGLHSSAYCHFTSPIRRYPDLVCHRALLSAVGGGEQAPRAGELAELGAWTSEREREAMVIERDADDVARCFLLEKTLFEDGLQQVFSGEITGLISAGAFIAFGSGTVPDGEVEVGEGRSPKFEGMLPVRVLRAPTPTRPAAGQRGGRASKGSSRHPSHRGGSRGQGGDEGRDWWELNEQGTILRGERTGSTLRLGDPVGVRVARVDTIRGRVDLLPAEDRRAG